MFRLMRTLPEGPGRSWLRRGLLIGGARGYSEAGPKGNAASVVTNLDSPGCALTRNVAPFDVILIVAGLQLRATVWDRLSSSKIINCLNKALSPKLGTIDRMSKCYFVAFLVSSAIGSVFSPLSAQANCSGGPPNYTCAGSSSTTPALNAATQAVTATVAGTFQLTGGGVTNTGGNGVTFTGAAGTDTILSGPLNLSATGSNNVNISIDKGTLTGGVQTTTTATGTTTLNLGSLVNVGDNNVRQSVLMNGVGALTTAAAITDGVKVNIPASNSTSLNITNDGSISGVTVAGILVWNGLNASTAISITNNNSINATGGQGIGICNDSLCDADNPLNSTTATILNNRGATISSKLTGVYSSDSTGSRTVTNLGTINSTNSFGSFFEVGNPTYAASGANITWTNGDSSALGADARVSGTSVGPGTSGGLRMQILNTNSSNGFINITNYGKTEGIHNGGIYGTNGYGVYAENQSTTLSPTIENITINNFGTVRASGISQFGIKATSVFGSVKIGNYSNNSITATAGVGIDASALGNVTIINGDLVGPNPDGKITAGYQGIWARSTGAGDVSVTNGANASITAGTMLGSHSGIEASTNGMGTVTIQSAGSITARQNGVMTTAAGGATTITNSGPIKANLGDGVQANSTTGAIDISNTNAIASQKASAIRVHNTGAAASTILNDTGATLRGFGASAATAVISVTNAGTSPTTITNFGDIRSNTGAPGDLSDYAIASTSPAFGAMTISNSNMIRGRISLTDAADSFTNLSGATWETSGLNSFGGGANTFDNAADAQVQAWGTTTFDMGASAGNVVNNGGLIQLRNGVDGTPATTNFLAAIPTDLIFNNSGLIDLANDGSNLVSNRVNIQGNFVSSGDSMIAVNTQLGGVGSVSDRVFIDGDSSGTGTGIIVRDTVGGLGASNPIGIAVVGVKGSNSPTNFTLNSASDHYRIRNGQPVLDKGLYFYYMSQTPTSVGCDNGYICYSLLSAPTSTARNLPIAVTAAQTIWQEDALMWEDRQIELRDEMMMRQDQAALGQSAACADALRQSNNNGGVSVNTQQQARTACASATRRNYNDGAVSTWVKSVGSWTNRNNIITDRGSDGRMLNYDLGYRQNVFSMLGGADFIKKGVFNRDDYIIAGVMGGYLQSNVNFNQETGNLLGPTRFNYQGGTLGGSLTYMSHGFFVDGLLKVDLLSSNLYIPVSGLTNTTAGARTAGGVGNFGYRYDWSQYFIEPIATFTYSATNLGGIASAANNLSMSFGDGNDFRGGFGGRIGFVTPGLHTNHLVEASLTGRYWSIFNANSGRTIDILSGGVSDTLGDDTFGRDYGEVKGNLNIYSVGSGWSAFTNTGVRWNSRWTTVTAKGGVAYRW